MSFQRVLIIGGYGQFGGAIARLLADRPQTVLMIAGRSLARAEAFCRDLRGRAQIRPVSFDRAGDLSAQLHVAAPDLVIDASGPFQAYGADPYRLVKACLKLGICYLDLADGADFVAGIAAFDEEAQAKGIFALSGVSSVPALSAAAVADLSSDLARVDSIWVGIAPSPKAEPGLNVVQAIASYAGKPITLWRQGKSQRAYGLMEHRQAVIAPPGYLPLRSRRFLLVDVPDLQMMQHAWPEVQHVWTGAAPAHLQRWLRLAAWSVRARLLPSLSPFAKIMHGCLRLTRRGDHRGGMIVAITGATSGGEMVSRSWHLVAEGDDGPVIPAMASAAIVRNGDLGKRPMAGARPATGDLSLADFAPFFDTRDIHHGRRDDLADVSDTLPQPLYQRILGSAWHRLPTEIRRLHELQDQKVLQGKAEIDRGRSWLAKVVATLFRFPAEGHDIDVEVTFGVEGKGRRARESWHRDFAGQRFRSYQQAGEGARQHLIVERFGPCSFDLAVITTPERLYLVPRRMYVFGCPLPKSWTPTGETYEAVKDGRFHFHVEIAHPLIGLIVRYRGWLVEKEPG